jgi:hypothetical protein
MNDNFFRFKFQTLNENILLLFECKSVYISDIHFSQSSDQCLNIECITNNNNFDQKTNSIWIKLRTNEKQSIIIIITNNKYFLY